MNSTSPLHAERAERALSGTIPKLVDAARRRSFAIALFDQAPWFLGTVLAAAILALLFGTDLFSLVLVVLTATVAAGFYAWQVRSQIPAPYSVAQIVDRELRLNDSVSTAYFLLTQSEEGGMSGIQAFQVNQAASLASTVEPRQAFPFRMRRRWTFVGALAMAAFVCFGARYLVHRTLDLRQPLVTLHLESVFENIQNAVGTREVDKLQEEAEHARKAANGAPNGAAQPQNSRAEQEPPPLPAELKADSSAPGSSASSTDPNGGREPGSPKSAQTSEPGKPDGNASGQPSAQEAASNNQPNSAPAAGSKQGQSPKAENQAAQNGSASNPGMMSRLKDALSSMMAKMQPQNSGQKGSNSGDAANQQGQTGQQSAKTGEQSASQQGKAGQDKASSDESSSGQGDGQTAEKAGGAQGHSSSKSQERGSDAQSGIGRQDGDKQLRDAEQQQAMGKLAEILGKRSANLTGDMTVETPGGNQQLKTAYSQQQGRHVDSGGEINRNEVPLRYQPYVRQYMEQIRKSQNADK